MKFWELTSVLRDGGAMLGFKTSGLDIVRAEARRRPEWREFGDWAERFDDLVGAQDREKLDHELPDAFARAVLARASVSYFLGHDDVLRSYGHYPFREKLTALEAFDRYGGTALEDANEYGSVKI